MGIPVPVRKRLPEWLRAPGRFSPGAHQTKTLLRQHNLHTVCESARCPNLGECFSTGTATFLLLGNQCTRACGFCSIETGKPRPPNPEEPEQIALLAKELKLTHVVLTSVNRDDLSDGGASQFVKTIDCIRNKVSPVTIEVLTPDFSGKEQPIRSICESRPDVYNHNIETVSRLYKTVRAGSDYSRSLRLLKRVKQIDPNLRTKSGLMLGLGERLDEVIQVMEDLLDHQSEILTIGQYCQPTKKNLPVVDYLHPDVFELYRLKAMELGFREVFSGPLVRSSYHAGEVFSRLVGTSHRR